MAAGAAVAGTVAGAYNTPGAVAGQYTHNKNAVESAVNAYSSRFDQSRSNGHGSIVAGVSALGGTLWGAYQEARGVRGVNYADISARDNTMSAAAPQAPGPAQTTETVQTTEMPSADAQ
jgi:hypothetical protein